MHPVLLWGMSLIAVPIILHLIQRFRVKTMEWAAMEFLLQIVEEQSRRLRVQDLLLLLLRILLLLLLALALARPAIKSSRAGAWLGSKAGDAVILLDVSYSMGTLDGPRSRFARSKELAGRLIEALPAGFGLSLVLMSQRPEVVVGQFTSDRELVRQAIERLQPSPLSGGALTSLKQAGAILAASPRPSKALFVISDFQALEWGESGALATELRTLADLGSLTLIPAGDSQTENLSVAGLALTRGSAKVGRDNIFLGHVINHGEKEAREVAVELVVDGTAVDRRALSVPPGQTARVQLHHLESQPGYHRGELRLAEDALQADNTRQLVFRAVDKIKVLGVTEARPARGSPRPTDWVELALNPHAARSAAPEALYAFEHVAPSELTARNLEDADLVCLAGTASLGADAAKSLEDWVRRGGGLLLFLGKGSENLNPALYRGGAGLLPWRIASEAVGAKTAGAAAADPLTVHFEAPDHPVWGELVARNYMDSVRFYRFQPFEPGPEQHVRVLARAAGKAVHKEEAAPQPLLLDIEAGRGRVLALASSADPGENNFALKPAWVAFLNQAAAYLRSFRREEFNGDVGAGFERIMDFRRSHASYTLAAPSGARRTISVLAEGELYKLAVDELPEAGFYELQNTEEAADTRPCAASVEPREGAIRCLGAGKLKELYGPSGAGVEDSDRLSVSLAGLQASPDIARLLLILALLAWIAENVLARRMSQS